jgi:hypothetical protein
MIQAAPNISHYRDTLEKFVDISQALFRAANKQSMKAVGMGEMTVNVPNGTDVSQIRLTEALYSPQVGYTLLSVGCLDDRCFSITFSGRKCTIRGLDGSHIGAIPKT